MRGHSKNTAWFHMSDTDKLATVRKVLTTRDRYPVDIARDVGVSAATTVKYLHMLVRQGLAIAEPELHRAKTGSTPRMFRLAKPGEDRPDMDEPAAAGYVQDDSNGTRSNRFEGTDTSYEEL